MSVYSEHSEPPLEGAGLLHGLDLVCIPPSQLAEHTDHGNKGPRPPSTENRKMFLFHGRQTILCSELNGPMKLQNQKKVFAIL